MTSERLFNSFIPPKKFYTPKTNFWLRPWSSHHHHDIFSCTRTSCKRLKYSITVVRIIIIIIIMTSSQEKGVRCWIQKGRNRNWRGRTSGRYGKKLSMSRIIDDGSTRRRLRSFAHKLLEHCSTCVLSRSLGQNRPNRASTKIFATWHDVIQYHKFEMYSTYKCCWITNSQTPSMSIKD